MGTRSLAESRTQAVIVGGVLLTTVWQEHLGLVLRLRQDLPD